MIIFIVSRPPLIQNPSTLQKLSNANDSQLSDSQSDEQLESSTSSHNQDSATESLNEESEVEQEQKICHDPVPSSVFSRPEWESAEASRFLS